MAIGATCIWNIQTDGSAATAGGGYTSGGTDYSKTLVANLPANNTVTTGTSAGAGNTILTAQASADWVGNLVIPTAGTNVTLTAGVRYEVLSVVVGVSVTFSTNVSGGSICTGIASGATFIVGGAAKFYNSATDDALYENSVPGHTWYIKSGTHLSGGTVLSVTSTITSNSRIIGYDSTQGDDPKTTSRPTISLGANSYSLPGYWDLKCLIFTGTAVTSVSSSSASRVLYCKFTNTSGAAGRYAYSLGGSGGVVKYCELSSTAGTALQTGNASNMSVMYNYIHDSDIGIRASVAGNAWAIIAFNIFDTIVTTGIDLSVAASNFGFLMFNNTLYGAASPAGSSKGISLITNSGGITIDNNIITGFITGVSSTGTIAGAVIENNQMYNNTTNYSNVTAISTINTNPTFVDAPNGNFGVGNNSKALALPGTYPGSASISYLDIGAVQRKEDYPTITSVKFNDVFSNSELTGSYRWDTITSAQIAVGINHIQDGVTFTGTLASEVWSTITAAQIKMGVNQIQNSMTVTGTFSGETWTTLSSAYIANGQSQIQNSVTVTGTLLYPVAMSGTAGTVDIANIKENIRYILYVNNTSTGAPVSDISSGLTNRVKDVFKIHPEKILLGGHQMPALTTYMTSKNITAKTIAANQVAAKREAELTFSIVGLVTNQMVPNTYTSDQLDDDIEYLMENVEKVLRNYGDIGGYTRWSFPNSVTYHSSALDERNQLRVGILDLQCKVFY